MDELGPILRAVSDHPIPFLGGFFSGLFRLSANEDPVKDWLVNHMAKGSHPGSPDTPANTESGPQRIIID